MAHEFQLRSRRRKLIYFGVVIALFTVSLLYRQFLIEPLAFDLRLRAAAKGKVSLTSSAVRLALLGSRGLATCVLWNMAIEKQKRQQWNELELLVKSITTLQPYFVAPWQFLSWNLSFNVAVECDRTFDKYFYISRGIELLAEGDRIHEGAVVVHGGQEKRFPGNPNMRFHIGRFYLMKIGRSDETNVMRCFLDMSCIDPLERDAAKLYSLAGGDEVDLDKFEKFCTRHPRLIRRLRRHLRCETPRDVVDFLKRNENVPSRFGERPKVASGATETPLRPVEEQFPVLPPPRDARIPDRGKREFSDEESMDVFVISRGWFVYAQEPLPKLPAVPPLGVDERELDPVFERRPKMSMIIFRQYPALSQEFIAEKLQEEGWFDESGWRIRDWFDSQPGRSPEPVIVGRERKYDSQRAWQRAYDESKRFGFRNGLLLPAEREKKLHEDKRLFMKFFLAGQGGAPDRLTAAQRAEYDGKMGESFDAFKRLQTQAYRIRLTGFRSHYDRCDVERLPEIVAVRKMFSQAQEQDIELAAQNSAIETYNLAFWNWLDVLLRYDKYRKLHFVQTDTYEKEQQYLGLKEEVFEEKLKVICMAAAKLGSVQTVFAPFTSAGMNSIIDKGADRRRIIPARKVKGMIEWAVLYEIPHRREVQNALTTITQAPRAVPFAVSPFHRNLMLTFFTTQDLSRANQLTWRPILRQQVIHATGAAPRIMRRLRR